MWKYPPSQILVPVDFGDAARRAIQVAGALAARYQARALLLHAETFEAPAYFTHEQVALIERERLAARRVATHEVAAFAELAGVPFSVEIVQGSPAVAILDSAGKSDLIVMGTHGRRGPSRWWLGSVAERIAREADIPVLVVRAAADNEDPARVFARPMMIASPQALDGAANRYATGLADMFGGTVTPRAALCEADVAREREATIMVIAKTKGITGRFAESTERMLRLCTLPMLFVPGDQ